MPLRDPRKLASYDQNTRAMWRLVDPAVHARAAIMNFLPVVIDSIGHAFCPL
jgi:hypothetical protein